MKSKEFFKQYTESFLKQNSILNLVSKNDEKYLWEKHIYDSLAIEQIQDFKKNRHTLLDIGTGGGFPSVLIALCNPDIEVYALDSIRKKINAIENIKSDLSLANLHTICDRAENIKTKFDIITSRAVAPLKIILSYGAPLLNDNGIFVAYKSVKTDEEIKEAEQVLKKFKLKIIDIIKYELPLDEKYTRNLIVIAKK